MNHHRTWFKVLLNPALRRVFKVEICSIVSGKTVIGYGLRRVIKP
jgi:hypothetical protein